MLAPPAAGRPLITVIGGGLAGCEAAWQLAQRGFSVRLWEMRPAATTPAHRTGQLAELVCSNSLGSDAAGSAPRLLKDELRLLGCRLLSLAEEVRLPAGQALAVDRDAFAAKVEQALRQQPRLTVARGEVTALENLGPAILASGPLTSKALSAYLQKELGTEALSFYDAISPIVYGDSLDASCCFSGERRGVGQGYLNCPLTREEYERFVQELKRADIYEGRGLAAAPVFEGCMPIEALAERGPDSLRFGPMKPVGLVDPQSGRRPYAVLQLRREDAAGTLWNLVGFQTRLRKDEQPRVLSLIPALKHAVYARLGGMHRNTFLNSPRLLRPDLSFRRWPDIFVAGQISGVEGYMESIASGLLAALMLCRRLIGASPYLPPPGTALRSLVDHQLRPRLRPGEYQPMNVNFGIIEGYAPARDKRAYRQRFCREALERLRRDLPFGPDGDLL